MKADEFIEALIAHVHEPASEGVLEVLSKPPGRRPAPEDTALSAWYNALSDEAKQQVSRVVDQSVHMALFGLLCALDGASRITPHGTELQLLAIDATGTTLLNDPKQSLDLHSNYGATRRERRARPKDKSNGGASSGSAA